MTHRRHQDLKDPTIVQRNREDGHVPLGVYPDAAAAQTGGDSPYRLSLDGTWKFQLYPNPNAVPEGFWAADYDDSGWADIVVPGNWQLQGHDRPIYTNVQYPFPINEAFGPLLRQMYMSSDWNHILSIRIPDEAMAIPLEPPEHNPTGLYRLRFVVPDGWAGRPVFIRFEGVDSAFHLWVNGREVGYSTDSRLPAEFNLTPYVNSGENVLAMEIYRWPVSSYLEDQDYWRLSGIYRNVSLWAAPPVVLWDYTVHTDLDADYRDATLSVKAQVRALGDAAVHGYRVEANLLDAAGKPVLAAPLNAEVGIDGTVTLSGQIANPAKWSDEQPNLYTLVLTLRGCTAGRVVQVGERAHRFPQGGDQARAALRQRTPHPCEGGQPARARPGYRAHPHRGVHGSGHQVDEAGEHQRRPHLPLPRRYALV